MTLKPEGGAVVPLTCPTVLHTCLRAGLISVSLGRSHLLKHHTPLSPPPYTHTSTHTQTQAFVKQQDACQAYLEENVKEVRRTRPSVKKERRRHGWSREGRWGRWGGGGVNGQSEIAPRFKSGRISSPRSGPAVGADCSCTVLRSVVK